jgi:hypothetical protein
MIGMLSVPQGVQIDTPNDIRRSDEKVAVEERKGCAECGTIERGLMASKPNVGHGYQGPMYCMECNPRFRYLDAVFTGLERMGG